MSTDEKPTNCDVNSLFYELDTGDFYYFNGVWKKVGERVTLGALEDTETIQITENDVYDVTDYDYADVNVPGIIPTGTLPIKENGIADVTNYAEASVDIDYVTVNFNFNSSDLTRSNPTALSKGRYKLAATAVATTGGPQSGYALFGGGGDDSSRSSVVDAYDTTLTRTTPTALSESRENLAATAVAPTGGPQSGYALFGGGWNGSYRSAVVDAYGQTLTRTTPTALSQYRTLLAATAVAPTDGPQSGYALFGGGGNGSIPYAVVDAYDQTLTRTTPTSLSRARMNLAATSNGSYALFGGGEYGSIPYAVVDAYGQTLTRTTPTALSQARGRMGATSLGDYALFGGGGNDSIPYAVVDAYDQTLTRTTPTSLSRARENLSAASVATALGAQSGYALFAGGYDGQDWFPTVDMYDMNLTRTIPPELGESRSHLAGTNVGNYVLFGGGTNSSYVPTVDAYTKTSYGIQIFPESKYSFNGSIEQTSYTMQTITMEPPIVGYIKIKNTTVT